MFNPNLPAVYEITYRQPVAPRVTHTFIGRISSNTFHDILSITPRTDGSLEIYASTTRTRDPQRVNTMIAAFQSRDIATTRVDGDFDEPFELYVSLLAPNNSPDVTRYLDAIKALIFAGHLTSYEHHLDAIISGDELTDTEDNDFGP